jgi:hypothetical protein
MKPMQTVNDIFDFAYKLSKQAQPALHGYLNDWMLPDAMKQNGITEL